jgi:hypothetical protein
MGSPQHLVAHSWHAQGLKMAPPLKQTYLLFARDIVTVLVSVAIYYSQNFTYRIALKL